MIRALQIAVLTAFLSSSSFAQVMNFSGGSSTIFGVSGGSATVYAGNTETQFGVGTMSGQVLFGMTETTKLQGFDLIGGDTTLPANLPSDFASGSGVGFYARALAIHKKNDKVCSDAPQPASAKWPGYTGVRCHGSELWFAVGKTSQQYFFPMTYGAKTYDYLSMLSYSRTLTQHWTFNTFEAQSSKSTAIQSLEWNDSFGTRAAFSAGLGNGARYFAALFDRKRKSYSAKIGYTNTSKDFRLLRLPNALLVQNTGLSGQGVLNLLRWLGLTASQAHYQTPSASNASSLTSTVDMVGAFTSFRNFDFHATDYRASTSGHENTGQGFDAGVRLFQNSFSLRSSYTNSVYGRVLLSTISERITRRLLLTEFINTTATGTTINLGGSYSSNAFSASLGYEQEFFPFTPAGRSPFATTLLASVSVHFLNASATVGALANPGERLSYSAYGNSYVYGPYRGNETGSRLRSSGKYIITGSVSLEDGSPVQGAAISIIDHKGRANLVWTGSNGLFQMRVGRADEYRILVSLNDFTTPEAYRIKECPATATASREAVSVKIVLERQQ